jgi:hypothetical protein
VPLFVPQGQKRSVCFLFRVTAIINLHLSRGNVAILFGRFRADDWNALFEDFRNSARLPRPGRSRLALDPSISDATKQDRIIHCRKLFQGQIRLPLPVEELFGENRGRSGS